MSDTAAQGQDFGTGSDSGPAQNGPVDNGQGSNDYSLSSPFLSEVPEEHRSILEPYVKKWDAGVSRRFQELHSQYRPYQELGHDPETLSQAVHIMNMINENPQEVYRALAESLGDSLDQGGLEDDDTDEGAIQGLPQEFVQRIDQQQEVLTALAEYILDQRQQEQYQAEDQELDSYLNNLKTEFGDFDEEYVLTKMYQGATGEQAVKAYQQMVQNQLNAAMRQQQNLPPVLSGGGNVPSESQRVTDLGRKDVKNLVASIMAQANQEI